MKKILLTILLLALGLASGFGAGYTPYRKAVPERNLGDRKIPVLLYNRAGHTVGEAPNNDNRQEYSNLFNKEGYLGWGLTGTEIYSIQYGNGSVRDYFIQNSGGKYRPQFDVYGPVTVSKESYEFTGECIAEVCGLLGGQFNAADYDTDGDGDIDCVILICVSGDESESGTYRDALDGDYTAGGKRIVRAVVRKDRNIGNYCKDLGRYLGLPDLSFFSSVHEEFPDEYDLMGTGAYNNLGKTPPCLSSLERYMAGWTDSFEMIDKPGSYALSPAGEHGAYRIDTPNSGEFFLLEYRNGKGWDSYLPGAGLVVFHIDQSNNLVDGQAALRAWTKEYINVYSTGHPVYNLFHSAEKGYPYVWPGKDKVTEVVLTDWEGNPVVMLKDIGNNGGGQAFFRVVVEYSVFGVVSDNSGKPIAGAFVTVTAPDGRTITASADSSGRYSVLLDDDLAGSYVDVTASLPGYLSRTERVYAGDMSNRCDLKLRKLGAVDHYALQKYDESGDAVSFGAFGQYGGTVAMRYTAGELREAGLTGSKLTEISFYANYSNSKGYTSAFYVVVYFGSTPVLVKDVTNLYAPAAWVVVDITADNIVIPEDQDVCIGYALRSSCPADRGWWPSVTAYKSVKNHGGGYYIEDVVGENIQWTKSSNYEFAIRARAEGSSKLTPSDFGIAWIGVDATGEYLEVHPPVGKTIAREVWEEVGEIGYVVHLTYKDGTTENVYYMFE